MGNFTRKNQFLFGLISNALILKLSLNLELLLLNFDLFTNFKSHVNNITIKRTNPPYNITHLTDLALNRPILSVSHFVFVK